MPKRPSSFSPPRLFLSLFALLLAAAPACPAAALSAESSSYLRAHATGPVKWLPWGEAAFARAKQEQKPVFLFIGSLTNELTRATHRQTFANADAAAFLNDTFVCVLVDAKEQPELTALYQNYLAAAKQLKGLPMNLFLTPELKPFEGANYLPPTEEWGKEGFLTVAKRAGAAWKADPAAQRTKADEAIATVVSALPAAPPPFAAKDLPALLQEAAEAWSVRADTANTGFGDGSKYPEPELLRFLLGRPATRDLALATLKTIATSSLRDPLDGGFFRYTTDPTWRIPYLQKNLVDQARLALAFLDAIPLADQPGFKDSARGALAYMLDTLAAADGEFTVTLDATPEDITAHYLWTYADLTTLLGAAAPAFATAYGATEAGNLAPDAIAGLATAGKNILYRATPLGDAAAEKALAASAAKLRAHRDQVAVPLRDERATSGAHGLALIAFARGGADLADARFTAAAKAQVAFIRARLLTATGELRHLADSPVAASAQDYALVARGLVAYARATGDAAAGKLATALIAKANAKFYDAAAGRYLAAAEQPAAGLWAKTYAAEPAAGDLPSAEAVMLLTLRAVKSTDTALVDQLVAALAAEVKAAAETARGDQLLALAALP